MHKGRAAVDIALGCVVMLGVGDALSAYTATSQSSFCPMWLQLLSIIYTPLLFVSTGPGRSIAGKVGRGVIGFLSVVTILLFLSAAFPVGVLPVASIALLWLFLFRHLTSAAVTILPLGLLAVIADGAIAPRRAWLGILFLQLLFVVVAGVLLHGRVARQRMRRVRDRTSEEEPLRESFLRVPLAVSLFFSVGLCAILLIDVQGVLKARLMTGVGVASSGDEEDPLDFEEGSDRGRTRSSLDFSDNLDGSNFKTPGDNQRLFRLRRYDPRTRRFARDGSPFLLRASYLDQIDANRFSTTDQSSRFLPIHSNGEWTRVAREDPSPVDPIELRIERQLPIGYQGAHSLLFGFEPFLAFDIGDAGPRIDEVAQGVFTLPSGQSDFDYRVLTTQRGFDLARLGVERDLSLLRGRSAELPRRIYASLPNDLPLDLAIQARAREIAGGSTDDLGRVSRVVNYLRSEFRYNREIPFGGNYGDVAQLLQRREGLCTHFATTGVLLLRGLGIPSRIAIGFLVQDYDDDTYAYGVWDSNRHAWIEVYFEGAGWIPFDATPASALAELVMDRRFESESEELDVEIEAPETLSSLFSTIRRTPAEVMAFLGEALAASWRVIAGVAILLGLLLLGFLAQRRRNRRLESGLPPAEHDLFLRLIATIERFGVVRRNGTTPRELAAELIGRGGPEFSNVMGAIESINRARFGRSPLSRDEITQIERLVAELRSRQWARRGVVVDAAGTPRSIL